MLYVCMYICKHLPVHIFCLYQIVVNPHEFNIDINTTGDEYGNYKHGGIIKQVKVSHTVKFVRTISQLYFVYLAIHPFV